VKRTFTAEPLRWLSTAEKASRLFSAFLCLLSASAVNSLHADITWKAPAEVPMGALTSIEMRESDPSKPAPPRPPLDDRLGTLPLRGIAPLSDGRGWRLVVQPMAPGTALIAPLDLGDGRRTPELRLTVPRAVAYGGPWLGYGGAKEDLAPPTPFPWGWALLTLAPFLAVGAWVMRRWAMGQALRHRHHAIRAFRNHWPPVTGMREELDEAHRAGRDLLASHLGEEARGWGPADLKARELEPWDRWAESLDTARFSASRPHFPNLNDLMAKLRGDRS